MGILIQLFSNTNQSKMKILIFAILILTIISCTEERNNGDENVINLSYNNMNNPIDFSKYISNIEIIKLESNDSSMFDYIKKVIFKNDKFYLLDSKTSIIKIFNIKGKFINALNIIGKGPQEANYIKDFDVDNNSNIHILAYRKILVFSSGFEFIKKYEVEDKGSMSNICYLDESNYIIYYRYAEKEKDHRLISLSDLKSNVHIPYFGINYKTISCNNLYNDWENNILFTPPIFDNDIYIYEDNEIKIKYKIDFGKYGIKGSEKEHIKKNQLGAIESIKSVSKGKATFISDFWDTQRYIFFNFTLGMAIHTVIYDKLNKKTDVSRLAPMYGNLPISFNCFEPAGNYFFGLVYPYDIDKDKLKSSELFTPKQIETLINTNVNDNGIIVKYNIK
jgi:hypothetical protein